MQTADCGLHTHRTRTARAPHERYTCSLYYVRLQPLLHTVKAITYGYSLDLGDFVRNLPSRATDDATGRASWQRDAPPLLVMGAECDAIVDLEGECTHYT